jgi:dienelactone hydrolase
MATSASPNDTDARHWHHRTLDQPYDFRAPADLDAWKIRAAHLREHLRTVLGIDQDDTLPLDAHVTVCGEGDGYVVERVWFQSRPGFLCTGNLFRPPEPKDSIPAILNPHGHWAHGRLEDGPLGSIRARCIQFARMGMAALAYDMVGYNDSLQVPQHRHVSRKAALWGLSPMALQVQNGIRAASLLQSLPYVDSSRLGCTGASGGGTQTFLLGALDPRIAVLAPVNMVSAHYQGGCVCENAPGLRTDTNNVEIAALAAPRPLLLVSATGDWTVNTPRVEYPAIRSIYALYGAADGVQCVQEDSPHNYHAASRAHVYRWFARWFLGEGDPSLTAERPYAEHPDAQLRVFPLGKLPRGYQRSPESMRGLEQAAQAARDAEIPTDVPSAREHPLRMRSRLKHILSIAPPSPGDVLLVEEADTFPIGAPSGQPITLRYPARGTRVPGRLWLPTAWPNSAAVVLHPAGLEGLLDLAGHPNAWLRAVLADDRAVLAISPLGTTAAPPDAPARRDSDWFWATYNPPLLGEQVLDVLTALAALRQRWGDLPISLVGVCGAGAWSLLAGALDAKVAAVFADVGAWAWDDPGSYLRELFAPSLARYGLLPAVAAGLAPRPLALWASDLHDGSRWPRAAYRALGAEGQLTIRAKPTPEEIGRLLDSSAANKPEP